MLDDYDTGTLQNDSSSLDKEDEGKNGEAVEFEGLENIDDNLVDVDKMEMKVLKKSPIIFFSTSFGQTKAGSISIANSHSTGKSGSSKSHAVSY